MPETNALAVLRAALPRVLERLPASPRIRLLRAVPGLATALPADAVIDAEQGFRPLHALLEAEGIGALGDGLAPWTSPGPFLTVVLPPRSREEGRALLARAVLESAPGGQVIAAVLNDEGAKSFEKDLAALAPLAGVVTKAHGRAFFTGPLRIDADSPGHAQALQWSAADAPKQEKDGLWSRPGVFNEGRLDGGSALLIEHLPTTLKGAVADFGAGSGLLARAVLARCPAVTSIALFEAEARALDLARRNLASARVAPAFHWHDVAAGVPGRFDAIVCNPPFHVGTRSVPALGRAFITSAAKALGREGQLLLVANRHLPYEDELRGLFAHGELLAEQGGFKVYRAWNPKA